MGPARHRRTGTARTVLPRRLSVRTVLADDPPQAGELPGGVRRLRARARRALRQARRRTAAEGCRHRAPPREDRSGDRQRPRNARSPRSGNVARRGRLGPPRESEASSQNPAGPSGDDPRVGRALQGAEAKRIPVRRPHDRVSGDAGLRRRQRPHRRLLRARRRPARHRRQGRLMLDERVRSVLQRLEAEDAAERERGLPAAERSRAVARTTGQFLFALVAPQLDCEVLEVGGSRGYSTIWLAAGVRSLGGRVLSLEHDPAKVKAWRANIAEAGLEEWAELIEGDAAETIPGIDDVFDVVFLDAEKEDYEQLFQAAREKLEPGALVVADNVLSHEETLGSYSRARQNDPSLESVTVPLDRGLELSVILRAA